MPITAVEFSPDGSQVFVGGYHELTVWNPADGKLARRIPRHRPADLCHPFQSRCANSWRSPAARRASTAKCGCSKPDSGELVKVLGMTSDVVFDCAFQSRGDRLATAAADGVVRVFDVASGSEQLTITSHSDWVFAVAWNADGTQLATGSRDKTAKVFDAKNGRAVDYLQRPQSAGAGRAVSSGWQGSLFGRQRQQAASLEPWRTAKRLPTLGLGGEAYKLTPGGRYVLRLFGGQ